MADENLLELHAVVTDAGLAAASIASPTGPWINIVRFSVGSAYGYGGPDDPQQIRQDTDLRGVVLYDAPITGYINIPPKTLNVQCVLPPEVGPFEFGELALWLPDDVLFCKLVFPKPQLKTSTLVTNVASRYTFNCLINLEQSTAIFQINGGEDLERILAVDKWSDVLPQREMANAGVDVIIVKELDAASRSTILHASNQDKWTIGSTYDRSFTGTVVSATTSSVTLAATDSNAGMFNVLGLPSRSLVIETSTGRFRSVSSVANIGGGLYTYNFNPDPLTMIPGNGTQVIVHRNDTLITSLMTTAYPGIGRPGNGIALAGGIFSTSGLLHGVPGAGRVLTSADNLNSSLPSGEYDMSSRPAGLPGETGVLGRVRISNYGSHIVQQFFPIWSGDGVSGGNNVSYWRIWSGSMGWSPWRPMGGSSNTRGGTLQWLGSPTVGGTDTISGTFAKDGQSVMLTETYNNGSSGGYRIGLAIYINGTQVMRQGHGDTYGTGGGAGLSITGMAGMTYALQVHGWYAGMAANAFTIMPN